MGDVDIVIDLYPGKGPLARGKFIARGVHAPARHAKAGIGAGGQGVIEPGRLEHIAGAVLNSPVGGFAIIDLQVGAAVLDLGQGLQILIGQTHAAIGAAAINA